MFDVRPRAGLQEPEACALCAMADAMYAFAAVSYTHLDVYKRQLRTSVYAQIQWAIGALGLAKQFRCTVSPMECTYLPTGQDVYKRQAYSPSMAVEYP